MTVLIGSFFGFAEVFEAAFRALWPGPGPSLTATPGAELAYMIAIILAADLGFFIGHYLTHKVPLLWEFHKVHHSAPVLNPLTNYRFHPVDRIPIGLFMGLLTALVKGGFGFAYPGGIAEMTAVNVGVLLLFNLSANLRPTSGCPTAGTSAMSCRARPSTRSTDLHHPKGHDLGRRRIHDNKAVC